MRTRGHWRSKQGAEILKIKTVYLLIFYKTLEPLKAHSVPSSAKWASVSDHTRPSGVELGCFQEGPGKPQPLCPWDTGPLPGFISCLHQKPFTQSPTRLHAVLLFSSEAAWSLYLSTALPQTLERCDRSMTRVLHLRNSRVLPVR